MICDLTDRQLGTVLAALREWQNSPNRDRRAHIVATDEGRLTPLTDAEINDLCEDLNFATTGTLQRKRIASA